MSAYPGDRATKPFSELRKAGADDRLVMRITQLSRRACAWVLGGQEERFEEATEMKNPNSSGVTEG